MDESLFFSQLLQEHYDVDDATGFQQLTYSSFEEGHLVYQIQHATGTSWVARAYRRDRVLPDWFPSFYPWSTQDAADWLLTRAATLACLEQQGYPAPQVIRTKGGDLLAEMEGWSVLVTTFIDGRTIQPTLEQLRRLGAAVGRLHALNPDQVALALPPVGKSMWYFPDALATTLAHLTSSEPLLPAEWVLLHAAFRENIQYMQQYSILPTTIIHADGWAANAIQTKDDEVLLIDWDCGGLGLAILDLGRLLSECHLESQPRVWHIDPDAHRIAAVVDGYMQQRMLTHDELAALPHAIRFGVAFIGALHFDQATHAQSPDQQWIQGMEQRFARLQNRWAVSQEIALIARRCFEQF